MDELSAVLKARELVNKTGPTGLPISVKAYAENVGAVIRVDYDLGPDELGFCTLIKGKHHISVNGKDGETRRRFTVCHELGHIVLGLPSEHCEMPWWSYAKRSPNEILCDVFAAELLLPYKLFKPLVDKADMSLDVVDKLAQDCDASNMATGSRFAALAKPPCAFVLAEQGKVRYASRSTTLREARAWILPRTPLPQGSVSGRLRGGGASNGPEEVPADMWFSDWERGGALLEDARHHKQWDQTVALLWFEDEEMPPPNRERREREEEEFGLAELDGVLPWPGRKRRR